MGLSVNRDNQNNLEYFQCCRSSELVPATCLACKFCFVGVCFCSFVVGFFLFPFPDTKMRKRRVAGDKRFLSSRHPGDFVPAVARGWKGSGRACLCTRPPTGRSHWSWSLSPCRPPGETIHKKKQKMTKGRQIENSRFGYVSGHTGEKLFFFFFQHDYSCNIINILIVQLFKYCKQSVHQATWLQGNCLHICFRAADATLLQINLSNLELQSIDIIAVMLSFRQQPKYV